MSLEDVRRLETGDWRLETGDWRLETGVWSLERAKGIEPSYRAWEALVHSISILYRPMYLIA
ncbi:hypothetical protein TUM17566_54840 [Klebsiella pneumoniae]|nr:hypothetical protein TUM17566_54840 [Klebsiella pneumoniae]